MKGTFHLGVRNSEYCDPKEASQTSFSKIFNESQTKRQTQAGDEYSISGLSTDFGIRHSYRRIGFHFNKTMTTLIFVPGLVVFTQSDDESQQHNYYLSASETNRIGCSRRRTRVAPVRRHGALLCLFKFPE